MTTPTALEEHLAHNTAAIDDISTQMAQQWAAIQRLEAQVERLAGLMQSMADDGPSATHADALPPHY